LLLTLFPCYFTSCSPHDLGAVRAKSLRAGLHITLNFFTRALRISGTTHVACCRRRISLPFSCKHHFGCY
jgi:hypothetical protein